MFDRILQPAPRPFAERAMIAVVALALVFVCASIWAFATGFARAERTASRAVAVASRTDLRGAIQCTTDDGTVVLVELRRP